MPDIQKLPSTPPTVLLGKIKEAFPEQQWKSYVYIDEGWDHEVIILDNAVVFRFPNDAEYRRQLRNEITILKQLKALVLVQVPNYTFVAPDHSFAGYPIVPGTQLRKSLFDDLSKGDRTLLAKQLAGFLSMMHTYLTTGHTLDPIVKPYMAEDQAMVKQQAQEYLAHELNDEDFSLVEPILADIDELLQQSLPSVFLHGDVYHNHLLWDVASQQLGIIDFSDMTLGDPAFDFAELYEYGEDFVQEVYAYYTGPKDDTFLARAWRYQQWVGVYMLCDYFVYHKTSFAEARKTFDRIKVAVV